MKSKVLSRDISTLKQLVFLTKIYFRHQKKLLFTSLILGFFAETLAMVMPQLTGNLVGSLSNWQSFKIAAILFLTIGLCQFLFAVSNDVFDRLLKDRIERDSYCATHKKILSMDPDYLQKTTSGEMLLNINSGAGIAYKLLEIICFPVFYGGGMIAGIILLYKSLNGIQLPMWLIITLVAAMAIQPFQTWFFGKLIAKAYTKVRASSTQINEEILNDLDAPIELRIMAATKQRLSNMFAIQHLLALRMDKAMLLHITSRYSMTLLILLFQFAIVVSVLLNYNFQSTVIRDLVASILLIPLMFNHLEKLQQMYNGIKDQEPYISAVYDVFQQKNEIPEGNQTFPVKNEYIIKMENISFSYTDKKNVLNNLNLQMKSGLVHSIVAPAGEGKSTILKLTGRLYLPQKGCISFAGVDILNIQEEQFRKHCVICSQFPLFIKGTIRQNFQLQKSTIQDEEIIHLCNLTGFSSIAGIKSEDIPDYKIALGADNLSGGQRRLLALSRCLSCKPSVLLLDEPSVGVDGPTINRYLVPVIRRCQGNMTVIIVDHNISFISEVSNQVYALQQGHIIESGSPQKLLLKKNGCFYNLHKKWSFMQ